MKYIIDPSERSVLVLFSIFFTPKKLRDRFKETTPTTLCTLLPERDHQEVSNCLKRTDVTLERGKKSQRDCAENSPCHPFRALHAGSRPAGI